MRHKKATIVVIAMLVGFVGGYMNRRTENTTAKSSYDLYEAQMADVDTTISRKLHFDVIEASEPGFTFTFQDIQESAHIAYYNLAEVNIVWDNQILPLNKAINAGKITVAELFAYARLDSRNGFCHEAYISNHGLSHFCYTYPECELWITFDILETPDENQHLISEVYFYNIADTMRNIDFSYVDETSEWGYFLDREDWGITFEVSDISPTQITINYSKHRAQEIGELSLIDYTLFSQESTDTSDSIVKSMVSSKRGTAVFPISIISEGSNCITIDWPETANPLAPGKYLLKLSVLDNYDESTIHPLMKNYYDKQSYYIEFMVE